MSKLDIISYFFSFYQIFMIKSVRLVLEKEYVHLIYSLSNFIVIEEIKRVSVTLINS